MPYPFTAPESAKGKIAELVVAAAVVEAIHELDGWTDAGWAALVLGILYAVRAGAGLFINRTLDNFERTLFR